MSTIKFISFLSFNLVIVLAFSQANAWDGCRRTSNVALCQSIVHADPRNALKTNFVGIGTILKDKAVSIAVSTSNKISSLIRITRNKRVVDVLRGCSESYSRAIPKLKSADFNHFNYIKLIGEFSEADDAPKECKISFQEPGVGRSPIEREVQSLIDIGNILLEIVNLRQCNKPSFSCNNV